MRAKLREVVCMGCGTHYLIPVGQKRLQMGDCCANEECECRKFRAVKKRGSTKEGK